MHRETKHLNHGDICNEIETRLGLYCKNDEDEHIEDEGPGIKPYFHKQGDELGSDLYTFEVEFKETKEALVVMIKKRKD